MEFNLPTILSITTLATVLINVVLAIRKPNEEQNKELISLRKDIDNSFTYIGKLNESLNLIKTNHLSHIESEQKQTSERLTRIETILEERLPRK